MVERKRKYVGQKKDGEVYWWLAGLVRVKRRRAGWHEPWRRDGKCRSQAREALGRFSSLPSVPHSNGADVRSKTGAETAVRLRPAPQVPPHAAATKDNDGLFQPLCPSPSGKTDASCDAARLRTPTLIETLKPQIDDAASFPFARSVSIAVPLRFRVHASPV